MMRGGRERHGCQHAGDYRAGESVTPIHGFLRIPYFVFDRVLVNLPDPAGADRR
jgi:hypothetical protein